VDEVRRAALLVEIKSVVDVLALLNQKMNIYLKMVVDEVDQNLIIK